MSNERYCLVREGIKDDLYFPPSFEHVMLGLGAEKVYEETPDQYGCEVRIYRLPKIVINHEFWTHKNLSDLSILGRMDEARSLSQKLLSLEEERLNKVLQELAGSFNQ